MHTNLKTIFAEAKHTGCFPGLPNYETEQGKAQKLLNLPRMHV